MKFAILALFATVNAVTLKDLAKQSADEIEKFKKADADGDGELTYDELIHLMVEMISDNEGGLSKTEKDKLFDFYKANGQMKKAFKQYDTDKDGKLTMEEAFADLE